MLSKSILKFAGWEIISPNKKYTKSANNKRTKKYRYTASSPARLFSTKTRHEAWKQVNLPYRLSDVLRRKAVLPKGENFTILTHAIQPYHHISEIYSVIGTEDYHHPVYRHARDIPIFNPARTAKQYVGMLTAAGLKIEDDEDYLHTCGIIYQDAKQMIDDEHSYLMKKTAEIEQAVKEIIHQAQAHDNADNDIASKYQNMYSTLFSRHRDKYSSEQIRKVIESVITDDLKKQYLREVIRNKIEKIITDKVIKHQLTSLEHIGSEKRQQVIMLPHFDAESRLMQVVAGGPATGKSSATKLFAAEIKSKYGLSLADFAFISTDRFRKFIASGDNSIGSCPAKKGLYTQDEARLMTEEALQLIQNQVMETGFGPNIFFETVSPTDLEINIGTYAGGKMRVNLTSYPAEASVEGCYKRAMATNERLPPVQAVLNGQQTVSRETPKTAKYHRGKNIKMALYDTYHMLHAFTEKNPLIALLDCEHHRTIIRDIHGFLDFILKSHINPFAKSPEEILLIKKNYKMEAAINTFIIEYADREILFVDPRQHDIDYHNLAENTYAVYHPDTGVTIKNQILFDRVKQSDSDGGLLLIALHKALQEYRDFHAKERDNYDTTPKFY